MSQYDIEREKRNNEEIRKAFREMFPLASDHDLPWAACHIKDFLRGRIEQEVHEGIFHFQQRVVRVLCEVSPPKTHVEDMCRIVVDEAKRGREDRLKLEKALDEALQYISKIASIVGCHHTEDPKGKQELVCRVQEMVKSKEASG